MPSLSRIRGSRALWPANGGMRPKSRRRNTMLSDRRLRRSRAGGVVRPPTCLRDDGRAPASCGHRYVAIAIYGHPLLFLSRSEGTGLDRSLCSSRHTRGRLNATYAYALPIPRIINRSARPACAAQAVQGGHKTHATMIARMRLFFGKADSGAGTVLPAPRRLRGRGPSLLRCYESLLRVLLALFFMPT